MVKTVRERRGRSLHADEPGAILHPRKERPDSRDQSAAPGWHDPINGPHACEVGQDLQSYRALAGNNLPVVIGRHKDPLMVVCIMASRCLRLSISALNRMDDRA